MKIKKLILAVPLTVAMLTPVYASADVTPVPHYEQAQEAKDLAKLLKSKAFNPDEEKKALEKLGYKNGKVQFEGEEPIVINFDDGSKIEYFMSVEPTPAERVPARTGEEISINAVSYVTYNVRKQYFYGTANANTRLYTDVKHDGRYVYVRQNFGYFAGTFTKSDFQKTRTIDGTGYNTDYATTELNGQFTTSSEWTGDYYTRTYLYRLDIDPAGAAYLRVIF